MTRAWVRFGAAAAVAIAAAATLALSRTWPAEETRRVSYSADIECYAPSASPREYVVQVSLWEGDSVVGHTVAEKQDSVAIEVHVTGERRGEIFRHGSRSFLRVVLSAPLAGRRMVDGKDKDVPQVIDCAP
jgi:hypothetical protein